MHRFKPHSAVLCLLLAACGNIPGSISKSTPTATPPNTAPATAKACDDYTGPALSGMHHYYGAMHSHSSYSDGDINAVPTDYYKAATDHHLDFFGSSEHSDTMDPGVFLSTGAQCTQSLGGALTCVTPTLDKLQKWLTNLDQANAATAAAPGFVAFRGFEWTSDRFGHINVYFSQNLANAKTDLGYLVTMETFWAWFTRDPQSPIGIGGSPLSPVPFGGGADGLATFNHPGDKCSLDGAVPGWDDPGCNWNDFAYVHAADQRMVGIELYNSKGRRDYYMDHYITALSNGWHVGAVSAEDGHTTEWAQPVFGKTVFIAPSDNFNADAIKSAMLDRRMYGVVDEVTGGKPVLIEMEAEGHPMGSRMSCEAGKTVPLTVKVSHRDGTPFYGSIALYDRAGDPAVLAQGDTLSANLPVDADKESWYFVRVNNVAGESLAYTSPIWISATTPAP